MSDHDTHKPGLVLRQLRERAEAERGYVWTTQRNHSHDQRAKRRAHARARKRRGAR